MASTRDQKVGGAVENGTAKANSPSRWSSIGNVTSFPDKPMGKHREECQPIIIDITLIVHSNLIIENNHQYSLAQQTAAPEHLTNCFDQKKSLRFRVN